MEGVFGTAATTEEIVQYSCDVDEEYVPKVGMTFESVDEAGLFYKEYAKCAGFSTKIRKSNRGLSLDVRRTIENNNLSGIRPRQTFQSFVTAASGQNEVSFIEKDVRNYITREVRNVTEEEDAK
ncbi:hypothetical protein PIB30_071489 [Stylosanthes scabra]|uniref:Protein FAR1-RELATED SEQUENCE n=1 Tax=Stylosanthes scabra TaxID=79078 RepID=A0ABU6ZMF1_9FABA|nr:hypothetical protein [Stylosanthes scabra]